MQEELKGIGLLESLDRSGRSYEVRYSFIFTAEVLVTPDFPDTVGARGYVEAVNGEALETGTYMLTARGETGDEDEEYLKVQNLGGVWTVVS